MKICLIAPTYLPARRANTIQVMKMAQAMTVLGHEVFVTSPLPPRPPSPCWERGESARAGGEGEPWDELARHYGLQHQFQVEWLPARSWMRRYDYGYRAVRYARQRGADLIYTRLPQSAALSSWLGISTIYEIHDFPKGRGAAMLLNLFSKGRGARRLVLITRALRDDLARRFSPLPAPPFTLIAPDGVDLERYVNLPAPADARAALSLPERFTLGYTGHLYPGRGVELLLPLANRQPDVTFMLVGGEPDDVARMRAEIEKAGIVNVILTGFVSNAELPRYQAASDVLLMPYQEQVAASSGGDIARYLSPMKMFEYLACGRPVISSDLPVLRETLTSENAILLPPDDLDAWVTAIQELRTNPSRREALARQARLDARKYSWEARAEKILEGL